MKYAWIEKNKLLWPICVQCRVLGVSASAVVGHRNAERFDGRNGVRLEEPFAESLVEIGSENHRFEKAQKGTALDEVSSAEGLHLADNLHERLGGAGADVEEILQVGAAPGLGPVVPGAFADGVEVAGPFEGASHGEESFRVISRYLGYWDTSQESIGGAHRLTLEEGMIIDSYRV